MFGHWYTFNEKGQKVYHRDTTREIVAYLSSHWHSATTSDYQGLPAVTTAQKADSLTNLP